MTFPAFGVITGVISEDSAVKPACRVACIDRATLEVVDTVVSDAYGVYRFEFLDPARKYTILALDDDTVAGVSGTNTPPSGRYVRIMLMGNAAGDYIGVTEVEIASTAGGADITTPSTPVWGNARNSGDTPSRVVDDSGNGWYTHRNTTIVPYVVIDLGSGQPVYEVRVTPSATLSYSPVTLIVQLSDDCIGWDTVGVFAPGSTWAAGVAKTFVLGARPGVTTYTTDAKNGIVADGVVPVNGFRDWDQFYRAVMQLSANTADVCFFDADRLRYASLGVAQSVSVSVGNTSAETGVNLTRRRVRTDAPVRGQHYPITAPYSRLRFITRQIVWTASTANSLLFAVALPTTDSFVLAGSDRAAPDAYATAASDYYSSYVRISRTAVTVRLHLSNASNASAYLVYTPTSPLPENVFVAVTVTALAEMKLYVNGALVGTSSAVSSYIAESEASRNNLWLSTDDGVTPAAISCAARFQTALSAGDIADLYTKLSTTPPLSSPKYEDIVLATRPMHYLKLDNADPALTYDSMLGGAVTKSSAGTLTAATGFTPGVAATTFSGAWVRPAVPTSRGGGGHGIAFALWLRFSATISQDMYLVRFTDSSGGDPRLGGLAIRPGGLLHFRPGSYNDYDMEGASLQPNTDYFIVAQMSISAARGRYMELFVNGVLAAHMTAEFMGDGGVGVAALDTPDTTIFMAVGAVRDSGNSVSQPFAGTLGHVAYYNRPLSADEVATLYAARTL